MLSDISYCREQKGRDKRNQKKRAMGNSESSSSQLPNHGNNQDPDQTKKKKEKGTEDETSSASSALMAGAALAGTALLAIGAWSLLSTSSSSEPADNKAQRVGAMTRYQLTEAQQEDHCSPIPIFDRGSYSRLIKIMSYNVWFRDDVEVHKRMGAIGQLVKKHSPDVILFQVTPLVYQLFQSSQWWELYRCFVPQEKETRKHFRMMLSKMPDRELSFENPVITGREICAAEIFVGSNYKPLVVANRHLKSPNLPGKNSDKRRAQAEEALKHLDVFSNAIFGGDMNWNEDSDGQFPLHGAWIDAWAQVRPTENGWTYDTEANRPLRDNQPLQKRLDRFVCKLRDFEIADIEMIGVEAIPGISYRPKMKENPVYPRFPVITLACS